MFLFRAGAFLEELQAHAPDIADAAARAAFAVRADGAVLGLDADAFGACRKESIDYAVMEKTSRAAVVPLSAGWSDIGSWAALHGVSERDAAGNALVGDVLALDCRDSYVRAEHWVVVAGRARITRDDELFDLERGGHTFIPLGSKHRIENPGTELLHISEVQLGDYLGEDDIVRFEDRYGREGRTD